jgi:hypothetical protein
MRKLREKKIEDPREDDDDHPRKVETRFHQATEHDDRHWVVQEFKRRYQRSRNEENTK